MHFHCHLKRCLLIICLLFCLWNTAWAQFTDPVSTDDASDPATMRTRVLFDVESYFFYQPAQFYTVRLGYYYGLQNGRHLFGLAIPFIHNIFGEDLQGFENTTGIGDIKMMYMGAIPTGKTIGLSRISPYFETTAPTGEYILGRGAGTWLYKPGIIFTVKAAPQITFYPEVKFQFSTRNASGMTGSDGVPNIDHTTKDGRLQNLTVQVPVVMQLESLEAWLGINAQYVQSFANREYFVFFRTDFGKMIGDKTAASLNITKFVAGQPLVNVAVQARFQFFIR